MIANSTGHTTRGLVQTGLALLLLSIISTLSILSHAASPSDNLSLTQVNGNLYRFNSGEKSGIVLLGSTGAAVGDPLDPETATALKQQLSEQFGLTVKFVFYTHADPRRARGAEIFVADGATLIAHVNSLRASTVKNGQVLSAPVTFTDSLTLSLGDEIVVLRHLGRNMTDDMIIAHFPNQNAVFAADFVGVESLPVHSLEQGFFPDWFASIDTMNQIDYAYFVPGEGKIGIRSDAIAHGYYLRELQNRVTRLLDAGQDAEQITSAINLQRYKKWQHFADAVSSNVRAMINIVQRE